MGNRGGNDNDNNNNNFNLPGSGTGEFSFACLFKPTLEERGESVLISMLILTIFRNAKCGPRAELIAHGSQARLHQLANCNAQPPHNPGASYPCTRLRSMVDDKKQPQVRARCPNGPVEGDLGGSLSPL